MTWRVGDDLCVTRILDLWRGEGPEPPGDAPVALGGSVTADALLVAHRQGLFPLPCGTEAEAGLNRLLYGDNVLRGQVKTLGGDPYSLAWWSPDPRPVLTLDSVHLGTGLTKVLCTRRRWVTTVDLAFERVVEACRTGREPRWLTDSLVDAMTELYRQGWYHSVEVWSGAELVGGAVGLGLGAVFSADTMFHRASGASQIALADLAWRLADSVAPPSHSPERLLSHPREGAPPPSRSPERLLDLQWDSPHARRLGARMLGRGEYRQLASAGVNQLALPAEPRTVDALLARLRARG